MALAHVNIKFGVNVKDFQTKLDQVEKSSIKFGKSMMAAGKSMSLYLTAPLAGVGAMATKINMDFDDSMRKVMATSGATGAEFDALKQKAKEMGATTRFSASESAEAMNYMALAGWKTAQILEGIPAVLNLAAASGEDLARVSDIVTDGLTAFGKSAQYASQFTDILAAASANSNTTVGMLGEAFKYVAPLAGSLGFEVEDTALALGLMANAGIKGSQSGTALRAIMSRLVKPTAESAEAMKALGITATNADGTMKPLNQMLLELRGAFEKLPPSQRAMYSGMLAGQEAMSGLLAITNASDADFQKLASNLTNAGGKAKEMAGIMEGGLGGAMRSLKSATEGLMIEIGEIMAPAILKIAEGLKTLVTWFSSLSDGMKTVIVIVGGLMAAIGPLITGIGFFAANILPMMLTGWKVIVPLLSLATLKIVAIVAAVGLLVAAGYAIYQSWDTVKEFFSQMWDKVKITFLNSTASLLKTFNKFTSLIGLDFSDTIKNMEKESQGIKTALDAKPVVSFKDVMKEMGESVMGSFRKTKQALVGDMGEIQTVAIQTGETVSMAMGGGGSKRTKETGIAGPSNAKPDIDLSLIKNKTAELSIIGQQITGTFEKISVDLTEGFNRAINDGIMNGLNTLGEGLAGLMTGAASIGDIGSQLLGALGSMMQQLGQMAIATGVAVLGIKKALQSLNPYVAIAAGVALIALSKVVTGGMKRISSGGAGGGGELGPAQGRRATGGTVIGGKQYLVGERGPELFTAGVSGNITPNNKLGGMAEQNIMVTVEGKLRGQDIYLSGQQYINTKGRTT